MLRLISATPSPFARKIRITLAEKNIPFELATEVPWNEDACVPAYNPLGKVPALILDDGETYYESAYIFQYLELTYPEPPLTPKDTQGLLEHRRLEVLADGLCDALVLTLIERTRAAEQRSERWITRQLGKAAAALAAMEERVRKHTAFACGDQFGLGDISVICAVDYMEVRFPELNWRSGAPRLEELHDRLRERPSLSSTLPTPQTLRDAVA